MNFLEKIKCEKENEVARAKKRLPLEKLKKIVRKSTKSFGEAYSRKRLCRSKGVFAQAISSRKSGKETVSLIAELKRASPSKGIIRKDFDVRGIAKLYGKYADAVSVLTDEKFFRGKKEYLAIAAKASCLSVLRKDFIIDEYQIYESRHYGADAILLISELLTKEEINRFIGIADSLGMDSLVEASSADSLVKALDGGARIIGLNNRDLNTMKADFGNTKKLLKKISKERLRDLIIVSESGIDSGLQIKDLAGAVDAVLVGGSLMESKNIEAKLKELKGKPLVKICGITNEKDASNAISAGADIIGLNFYEKSPRYIAPSKAKEIIKKHPNALYAGVFVNAKAKDINLIAKQLGLDYVQLHGDESPSFCKGIMGNLEKMKISVIKTIRVKSVESLGEIGKYDTPFILLDSFDAKNYGGTGKEIGFALKSLPHNKLVFLSGGINEGNVREKLALKPFAVDVCSGVEGKKKGIKDFKKMKRLIQLIRKAGN